MVIDYLKKACKYIYGNRVLMIVCVFAVFFVVANLATYISRYEYENFYGSCTKTQNSTESFDNLDPLTVHEQERSNKTKPKIASHSNHSLGSESTKRFFNSDKLIILLFVVKTLISSFDL